MRLMTVVFTPLEAARYAERYANRRVRNSFDHGPAHWRAVAKIGRVICLADPAVDPLVVFLFAAFHDTRRESEFSDHEHGARAAERVRALLDDGRLALGSDAMAERLLLALDRHDKKLTHKDPTIGACWDSDRLCLVRYGMRIEPAYLSNTAVKAALPTFIRIAKDAQPFRAYDAAGWDRVAEEYGYA
jgi:uncharacterized protein